MRLLVISGNPKRDGLCHTITQSVISGGSDGGADVHTLTVSGIKCCRVCGNGWGACRAEHYCLFGNDGFSDAQQAVANADAISLITPVYFGEMAEGLKSFMDRLRRCEFNNTGSLSGKPVLLIASAGGSGNGILSCLEQMSRCCTHTHAKIFDCIGVNRWNNDYKQDAIYAAAKAMAESRPIGETVEKKPRT